MNLDDYFSRIRYRGPASADLAVLKAVHHQHLLTIPYEDIDVQLGRPLDFDRARIFNKLVHGGRGGWCYEMNGLLEWALRELGFEVRRMSGAVNREKFGDFQLGNHLILEVMLEDKAYLVDVGFGDGIREPIPIEPGVYKQGGLNYELVQLADGYWRLKNQQYSRVPSFDFRHETADENQLIDKCSWLQTNALSPFVNALVVQRFRADSIEVLLGKVHTTITSTGKKQRTLTSLDELHDLPDR